MALKDIGPCILEYGGTPLGETVDGVTLEMDYQTAETKIDRLGETARKKIITGVKVLVKANLAEMTPAILEDLIPGSTLAGSALTVGSSVGADLVATAKALILKPILNGEADSDTSTWITILNASVTPKFSVPFKLAEQKQWAVEFEGHTDAEDNIVVFGGAGGS